MIDGNTAIDLSNSDVCQLGGGRRYVFDVMADGTWRTIQEIQASVEARTGEYFTEPCISARVRDLRKHEYGNHTVERRARTGRLFEYRLEVRS